MRLVVDGQELGAKQGETILMVARRAGIDIPTLCHHDGVEPAGACRLCLVEVTKPGRDEAEICPACLQPAEDGLEVGTHTDRVVELRRAVVDLLLARCPDSPRVQELARGFGVTRTSYLPREDPDLCVLCGLCIRICEKLGPAALSTAGRGTKGKVTVAFFDDSSECIGCGACALSCPTSAISLEDSGLTRRIWGHDFNLEPCKSCGRPTTTAEHIEHMVTKANLPRSYFELCEECRKQQTADRFNAVMGR